ncbi:MAG: BrnT family toxin [Clostridiales bacterium]|nr:BrnT family toxin [Clostridiales bacterium]
MEDRFIIIGLDNKYRELTVCHCYREDDLIWIISARKASEIEIKLYNDDGGLI